MNQSLNNVKLSQLKKMIEKLDEQYKGEDIDLSFEFLVGSFYPHVFQNVQKALSDAYTKGFIEGIKEGESK